MASFSSARINKDRVVELEQALQLDTAAAARGLVKYRRTVLFAVTALLVMAIAAAIAATKVNSVIAGLAEQELVKVVGKDTMRDVQHIQALISDGQAFNRESSLIDSSGFTIVDQTQPDVTQSANALELGPSTSSKSPPLNLEMLISPEGLPTHFEGLVAGLGVVEFRLFSPAGEFLWSSNPNESRQPMPSHSQLTEAITGITSSHLMKNQKFYEPDGTVRSVDVVEIYMPLQDSPTSPIVGVLEIEQEISTDLDQLVDETKSAVVWTTVATMAGLFFALLGFVVVSDRMIYQSNQKRLALADARMAERGRAQRELIRAHQQVAASEKLSAMGQISTGVAHDIRNPLGAIKNAAYMIDKKLVADGSIDSNPKLRQYLEIIDQQVANANQSITDLMDLARVGSPTLTETNLNRLLEQCLETLVQKDNVEISRNLDQELPPIMADGNQLQRVFLNLANNAQEAMPNGGKLTVTAQNVDDYVEIDFIDTGEGISDEDIAKIFDPLFTTKSKGTGLGLAVSQDIVQHHGGTIVARRNDVPSGGSTFEVRLPMADSVADPMEQSQGETNL